MALLKNTEQLFEVDEEENKEDRHDLRDMPPLEGDDPADGVEFDEKVDEKVKAGEISSVIATPGPPPRPTASDEEFIAPEGTPAGDPDYEIRSGTARHAK